MDLTCEEAPEPELQPQQERKPAVLTDSGIRKRRSGGTSGARKPSKREFLEDLIPGLSQPAEKKPKVQRERMVEALKVEMPPAAAEGLAAMDADDPTKVSFRGAPAN